MSKRSVTPRRIRLQKLLSDAGVCSRRHAEELIREGRALVNDEVVQTLPVLVDPTRDRVVVDGNVIRQQKSEYFLVHKPKGVVCTNRDPAGRLRAVDLLPPLKTRLNVVGRLDAESSGLLLMTNDGDLAEQVSHPRLELPKVYRVEVRGEVKRDIVPLLLKGVHLSEGKAVASEVEIVHRSRDSSVLNITLRQGRNRQIRRMLARFKHPVKTLKRIQIGPLSLKGLPVGACRRLTPRELRELRQAIAAAGERKRRPTRPRGRDLGKKASTKSRAGAPNTPAATEPTRRQRRVVS